MNKLKIERYLKQCIASARIPGAVCVIAKNKKIVFDKTFGWRQKIPCKILMRTDTIFDLASLTKPICTATITLMFYEQRMLRLSDPVEKFIPEFKNQPNTGITIKQLLTHTGGLPAWFPLYIIPSAGRLKFLAEINTGNNKVLYSCLGYILLGKIIERITGQNLARSFKEFITQPLSLPQLRFGPVREKNTAVTEKGNVYEKGTAGKYSIKLPGNWRTALIRGSVHDGNAYYALGNVAGNAGLFGRAEDIYKFLLAIQNGKLIKPSTYQLMIKDHTGGSEKRGLGWIVDPYPEILSRQAYYHTGFTGTMACVDPAKKLIVILLANAVHPRVKLDLMRPIRKKVVRLAAYL